MSNELGQINLIRGFINVSYTMNRPPGYTSTVTSITPTTITSTLMVTAEIPEDGITVSCVQVGSVTIQTAGMLLVYTLKPLNLISVLHPKPHPLPL